MASAMAAALAELPRTRRVKAPTPSFRIEVRDSSNPDVVREYSLSCASDRAAKMCPGEVCGEVATWLSDQHCDQPPIKGSQVWLYLADRSRQLDPHQPIPESDRLSLQAEIRPEQESSSALRGDPQLLGFWTRLGELRLMNSKSRATETREGHDIALKLQELAAQCSELTLGEVLELVVKDAPQDLAVAALMQLIEHDEVEVRQMLRYPTSSLPEPEDPYADPLVLPALRGSADPLPVGPGQWQGEGQPAEREVPEDANQRSQLIMSACQSLAGKKQVAMAAWVPIVAAWHRRACGIEGADELIAPLTKDILELAMRKMPGRGCDRWGMTLEFVSLIQTLDKLFESRLRRGPQEDYDDFEEATKEAISLLKCAKRQPGEKTIQKVRDYVVRERYGE